MKGKRVLHHDWTEEELEKVPCYKILIITYEQLSQLDLKSNNIILSLSVVHLRFLHDFSWFDSLFLFTTE